MMTTITTLFLPLVGVVLGGLITGVSTLFVTRQQLKANHETLQMQLSAQADEARLQRETQLTLERERHRRQRVEQAHEQLMRWCHQLESTIDDVWGGIHSQEVEKIEKIRNVLYEWPWKTLRQPAEAAAVSHYWTEATHRLISEFEGQSSYFMMSALSALEHNKSSPLDENKGILLSSKVFEHRGKLRKTLNKIRMNAHKELTDDKSH